MFSHQTTLTSVDRGHSATFKEHNTNIFEQLRVSSPNTVINISQDF